MVSGRVILTLGVAAVAAAGFYWLATGDAPPQAVAPAAAGDAMVAVTLPDLDDNAEIGARAFEAKCAKCHGSNGAGRDGAGPPLIHKIYEPGHHGDMAFLLAARNGVRSHHWRFGNMPPVKGITDAEVKAIVAFIRRVQKANGIF
ncbi:cytochrome C [Maritimibacter sp. 55A14]|uniref:c-type cytochrome n=1 Tax=Maritimibacter sp. 55A14 TaxID=2174844 RepID=UPI000D61F1A9|nr:cytochrome c [Maritimibacter sp. 55A14]PWE34033.1 cytochrome C [Maritimibacter sp. 55A14]